MHIHCHGYLFASYKEEALGKMIEKSHIVKKEKKKRETGSCPSSARLNRVPLLNRRGTFKSRIAADLFLSPPCITLMPLTTRYLTAAPHDVVRHILTCQIAVAFLTCFLTIITIHSSLYRVASSPLKVRHQALSPCVIVTATDNPLVLKSFFATMSMDIQQRPPIIAYTSNISHVNRDDLQHVMSKDDQLVVAQQEEYVDHFYSLMDQLMNTTNINNIVWMDPSSSIVSRYLIQHLCSIMDEHDGLWSICQSETVCTMLGVDTRNQTIRGMIQDLALPLP